MSLLDVSFVGLAILVAWSLGRPLVQFLRGSSQFDRARVERFSLSRYEVMRRLVSPDDVVHLRDVVKLRTKHLEHFDIERRRILAVYFQDLIEDFRQLQRAARYLVAISPADRSEDLKFLLRQHLLFQYQLVRIHTRLALHRFGLPAPDPKPLFRLAKGTREVLNRLGLRLAADHIQSHSPASVSLVVR
jgi:hypothetical protein